MALTTQTMTDEQRKSVALEYLKAFDNGGVTSTGGSILDLFAADAQVYFPKWGLANGTKEIGQLFGDVGGTITSIVHHYSHFNWVISGDMVVCEGTSHGEHRDGPWRAGVPEWAAGRWCDVFEIRDWKIQRCFIYLDPDYAAQDTARYPWLPRPSLRLSPAGWVVVVGVLPEAARDELLVGQRTEPGRRQRRHPRWRAVAGDPVGQRLTDREGRRKP
jgi:hypothetical protein